MHMKKLMAVTGQHCQIAAAHDQASDTDKIHRAPLQGSIDQANVGAS